MSASLDRSLLQSRSLIGPPGVTRPPSRSGASLAESLRSKSLSPGSAWAQHNSDDDASRPTTASREGWASSPSPSAGSRRRSSGGLQSGRYGPQPRKTPPLLPLQSAILPADWSPPLENIEDADDHMARRRKSKQAYRAWKSEKDSKTRMDSLKSQSMVSLGGGRGRGGLNKDALKSKSLSPAKTGGGIGFMALMAVAKFKRGGKRNHDQWLVEKEEERRAEYDARRTIRDMEEEEARMRAEADANDTASFATLRLEQLKSARESLKTEMLHQTAQLDFVPSRPTSSVGKHQRAQLVEPTEQEQWELGLDILKIQDMLDAAAPGLKATTAAEGGRSSPDYQDVSGREASAKHHDVGPRKRTERFPKKLPSVPTYEAVKGMRRGGGGGGSGGRSGGFSGATRSKSAVRLKKLERSPTPPGMM